MAFECAQCGAVIEDERLSVPRSGASCPSCGNDPARDPSPYEPEIEHAGRELAARIHEEMKRSAPGALEASLFYLEDLILGERGHIVTVKVGKSQPLEQVCSVCAESIPLDTGLRLELRDRWRQTTTVIGLCKLHSVEGYWAGDIDIHMNNEWPWLGPD